MYNSQQMLGPTWHLPDTPSNVACCYVSIPLVHREEYATWASMIVTQFGRLPGGAGGTAGGIPGFSSSPQRHISPAMGHLQHYYQVNDPDGELSLGPGVPLRKREIPRRGIEAEEKIGVAGTSHAAAHA